MKTLLLAISLLISTTYVTAQDEPLTLPVDGVWQMFWFSMIDFSNNGTFAYRLNDEVNFNDTLYYPVEKYSYCGENLTPIISFYVREDSGRWYQRFSEVDMEVLLFDFTLEIEDEISIKSCYDFFELPQNLVVTNIEEITMYDGTTRRKWTLIYDETSELAGNEEIWIEGIGNQNTGIFHGLSNTCVDLNESLHCFLQQEDRIFPVNEFPIGIDCCTPLGIQESELHKTILLFPNPASSKVTLQSSKKISVIEISDFTGRIVFANQPNRMFVEINIESLLSGSYLLSATTEIGAIENMKFLKE
jgi:hypothetical protein